MRVSIELCRLFVANMTDKPLTEIGNTEVWLIVPSRSKNGALLPEELRKEWEAKSDGVMHGLFGGATPIPTRGVFLHSDGRTTREEILVLKSAAFRSALTFDVRDALIDHAKAMCRSMGQESIFVRWGDHCYVVSEPFRLSDIPSMRFGQLSAVGQLRHLVMAWMGLDHPEKIQQVLSLDAWEIVEGDVATDFSHGLWRLKSQLREGATVRRAWAFTGAGEDLKQAIADNPPAGLQDGDLIFAVGKPGHLQLALKTKSGISGPRELRTSVARIAPVTRDLMLQILRREWDDLSKDLKRRPVGDRFFKDLQIIRKQIQKELTRGAGLALDGDSQGRATTDLETPASKGRKRRKKDETATNTPEFRESVRIVGRMIFLRFLIQKNVIPGGTDLLVSKFKEHTGRFFSDWLTPLWFDILNKPEKDRDPALASQFPRDIPYLNGGLFEERGNERNLVLSAALFDPQEKHSFLRLFRDFEFTLNEYEGSESTIKIDPSFFGRALESFNTSREKKKAGIHYTPKEIARALAAEAIIERTAHLASLHPQQLRDLLTEGNTLAPKEARIVRQVLQELRILDPAVGSGVLLWAALGTLLELDKACDGIESGNEGYQPGSHKWGERSRHFVCNCLYGVDISEEAVELTKLRLWLAVALSEDRATPLPDLELNIVRGDSLAPESLRSIRPGTRGPLKQKSILFEAADRQQSQLIKLTREYFQAGTADPARQRGLLGEIRAIQVDLRSAQRVADDYAFTWEVAFLHVFVDRKAGFDVVIANPPYVRVQEVDKNRIGKYRREWQTFEKGTGSPDLCFPFIELALRKLAAPDRGQLAFIQPNFRNHDAAKTLRDMLTGYHQAVAGNVRLWVDFDATQVFATATNYVSLLFAERTSQPERQSSFEYSLPKPSKWKESLEPGDLAWLRPQSPPLRNELHGPWLTVSSHWLSVIKQEHDRGQPLLGEIAEVSVGVQTSADEIFLFTKRENSTAKKHRYFSEFLGDWVELDDGIVRACVKGAKNLDFWILFPYDDAGQLLPMSTIKRRFPAAFAYLSGPQIERELSSREKGAFAGSEFHRFGRKQGISAAFRPKLIVPSALNKQACRVDREGEFVFTASGKGGGGAWGITPKTDEPGVFEWLETTLTREETWIHYQVYGSPQKGGWRGVDQGVLRQLPMAPR